MSVEANAFELQFLKMSTLMQVYKIENFDVHTKIVPRPYIQWINKIYKEWKNNGVAVKTSANINLRGQKEISGDFVNF